MPKRFEFAASVARDGSLCAEDRDRLDPGQAWTAEHLVLAALCRCTLGSLRYHAESAGIRSAGTAVASGVVTRRDSDGRYAFVQVECGLDVTLDPEPDNVRALVERAEHDCFISASLAAPTQYEWRVNGAVLGPPVARA